GRGHGGSSRRLPLLGGLGDVPRGVTELQSGAPIPEVRLRRRRRPASGGLVPLLALCLMGASGVAEERAPDRGARADRVFLGGRVWTGDRTHPRAQALAIQGDRIVAVGSDAEVRRHV